MILTKYCATYDEDPEGKTSDSDACMLACEARKR
jgi:hypothetical protein